MKTVLLLIALVALCPLKAAPSEGLRSRDDLDMLSLLAGMSNHGTRTGIFPPRCEAFFRESGEERVAALFLEAARRLAPQDTFQHYYESNGSRLVIESGKVHALLQSYFDSEKGIAWSDATLMSLERKKRLSFVAGFYARYFRDGGFHGASSPPTRATILILLTEGCRVYEVKITEGQEPETIHFMVQPSPHISQLFSLIDSWKPADLTWIER